MNTQSYDYTGFTRIKIERALAVDILREDDHTVTVADAFNQIKVEKVGDTLVLGQKGFHWMAPFHPRPHVVITLPELYDLHVSGACEVKVIGFRSGRDFNLKLSGASHMEMKRMSAKNLIANISGASNVTGDIIVNEDILLQISGASRIVFSGSANNTSVELSGASQARLGDFTVNKARLNISGASSAQVRVKNNLEINLSGCSRLEYTGNPHLDKVQIAGACTLLQR